MGLSTAAARHRRGASSDGSGLIKPPKLEPLNVYDAIEEAKERTWAKFDESLDLAVQLNVDPRKPNQAIRGTTSLPHGTGRTVRIGVFASGTERQAALNAGVAPEDCGMDDLVARISAGDLPFDRIIATPEAMPLVSKIGRILGPRGLMPSPKVYSSHLHVSV
jgi:large subunit ribosomal protein L1